MASHPLRKVLEHLRRAIGPVEAAEPTDGQLLQRFVAAQDEAAFARLLERYGPMVLGVCRRALGNAHDAEDAFQATFLVLVGKAGSLRDAERVGNWLYGVACRIARRGRIQAARRAPQAEEVPDMASTEPELVENRDLRSFLDEELQQLPRKYRVPLVLCYLEGRTNEAAARQLHWPVGTVKTRLARGRDLLRERLLRRGVALSAIGLAAVLTPQAVQAAVPPALASATLKAAGLYAAGAATGVVSATALGLATAAVREVVVARVRMVLGILVACTLLGGGAGLAAYTVLSSEAPPVPQSVAEPEPLAPARADGGLAVPVEQRVWDWQPTPAERRLDEIGWAPGLCIALRLAREHHRPLFLLTHSGDLGTARCSASPFNVRAGALSNDGIIALLNEHFVCVHLNHRDYAPDGRASAGEKNRLENICRQATGRNLVSPKPDNSVYILDAEGRPLACQPSYELASAERLALLLGPWAGDEPDGTGPVVAPVPQSRPPETLRDNLVLHLTTRYLDRRGDLLLPQRRPLGLTNNYELRGLPGEDWFVLDRPRAARFLPPAGAAPGTTWAVAPEVAAVLFRSMYPPTEDNDLARNRIDEGVLQATVVAVQGNVVRARLEGRLTMQHRSAPDRDDGTMVRAELEGFLDFEPARSRLRSLQLVSTRATYGRAEFGIALRSVVR
jgi:RNA polymerase sigma factor (sigma-70 family)